MSRRLALGLLAALVVGCATPAPTPSRTPATEAGASTNALPSFPPETRISSGGPEPRTAGYWVAWSSCGPGSQAAVASANGGRDAGWILVDDLLADPGVAVGPHSLDGCKTAVAVLAPPRETGQESALRTLAREVLTAELNLASGSETCPAVEATIGLGQAQLIRLDYDPASLFVSVPPREAEVTAELARILGEYNSGLLCQ